MRRRDGRRLFTARQVRQLLIAADYKCQRCGAELSSQKFETHHIRRHADGGPTQLYNGMVVCIPCHKELS
jgi:predicted restriction endonuclease